MKKKTRKTNKKRIIEERYGKDFRVGSSKDLYGFLKKHNYNSLIELLSFGKA